MDVIQDNGTGITVQGEMINNLRFADDIDLVGRAVLHYKIVSSCWVRLGLLQDSGSTLKRQRQ